MFLLLLLLPAALYLACRKGGRAALRFSAVGPIRAAGTSPRQNLSGTPLVLRTLALVLLVIALARPQMGTESVRDLSRGVAIEMVLDRSSSMGAELRYEGRRMTILGFGEDGFPAVRRGRRRAARWARFRFDRHGDVRAVCGYELSVDVGS